MTTNKSKQPKHRVVRGAIDYTYTANMCSEITVEVHLKNCNFEKLQFFTVDQCSLYFLQLKNCNFNIFTVFKNTTKKM